MAVTPQPFAGFTPDAIQFLTDLAENNDRAWFQPRKADYERLLKEPLEALCAALAERFAARGIPLRPTRSARPSGSTGTPASARTSRRTRPTSARASRGSRQTDGAGEPVDAGRPRERRLLQLPAGRDVRRRRDVAGREAAPRRASGGPSSSSPTACGRRSRSRASSPGSEAVDDPRVLQADPAGLPAGPPAGRHVPLEGRRLRAAAVRRRGAARRSCRTCSSTAGRRRCRSSVSRDAAVGARR